jgi:hypothetical protein
MRALQVTTLSANGQHLIVPRAVDSRNSRSSIYVRGTGMAERVIC